MNNPQHPISLLITFIHIYNQSKEEFGQTFAAIQYELIGILSKVAKQDGPHHIFNFVGKKIYLHQIIFFLQAGKILQ